MKPTNGPVFQGTLAMRTPRPAVFLDRDGVLIEDVHYLKNPEQVRLTPGAGPAVARLNAEGLPVVVVTNQSGVARGYFSETAVAEAHRRLDELLAEHGARVDRYYHCPHHPGGTVAAYRVACECRKPRPGMLLRAAPNWALTLTPLTSLAIRSATSKPARRRVVGRCSFAIAATPVLADRWRRIACACWP